MYEKIVVFIDVYQLNPLLPLFNCPTTSFKFKFYFRLLIGAKVIAHSTIAIDRLLIVEPIKERFELYSEHGHKYVWLLFIV
jgi:hypothetical protein